MCKKLMFREQRAKAGLEAGGEISALGEQSVSSHKGLYPVPLEAPEVLSCDLWWLLQVGGEGGVLHASVLKICTP